MNNPLLDLEFLKELDNQQNKEVYAKIISLTFEENPIEEISGKIQNGGSINVDGTSSIRRSCSLTIVAQDVNINDYLWGLNTKFALYIGLKNNINPHYDDIIWFKQGIFLLTSFNTSLSTTAYTISISGKDKMSLLNGDIGGNITALTTDFGTYDEQDAEGNIINYKYPIKEIIKEAVHQYAGEPYYKIIIEDLDIQGYELMEYRGDVDLFLLKNVESEEITNIRFADEDQNLQYYIAGTNTIIKLTDDKMVYDSMLEASDFSLAAEEPTKVHPLDEDTVYTVCRVTYGQPCGYRITDLVYAGDLIAALDSCITTSVLDKIVSMLGEYEYYYDINGYFHFCRKKTYILKSWNNIVNNQNEVYADSAAYTSALSYSFTNSNLINSYQNNPDLSNLKNDYSIWGTRTLTSGSETPIHLRYAIDEKPQYYKNYNNIIYVTEDLSYLKNNNENCQVVDWREIIYQMALDYYKYQHDDDFLSNIASNNFEYYPTGYTGYEQYYIDMQGFWRTLYNPDIAPIDLTNNDLLTQNNNFYLWDTETKEFINYTFSQSNEVISINSNKKYYYLNGIKILDNIIAEIQTYQNNINMAEDEKKKKLKTATTIDEKSKIENYYKEIINKNKTILNETKNNYSKKDFLAIKKDNSINYNLANNLVKTFYPNYFQLTDTSWQDYQEYHNYNSNTKYYLYEYVKDLSTLSQQDDYYTLSNSTYTKYTKTTLVDDKTKEPDSIGKYPQKSVYNFSIGQRYYVYKGFKKVSTLEKGNNIYYTYGTYKLVYNYQPNTQYFSLAKVQGENIFTPSNITQANFPSKGCYIEVSSNEVQTGAGILKGYCKVLELSEAKDYYLRKVVNGQLVQSTPTYFSRGETYYDDKGNIEFEYNRSLTYYLYVGYECILDLTNLQSKNYYFEHDSNLKVDSAVKALALGKIYYGCIQQEESSIQNGDYYIIKNNEFVQVKVLKEFKRGGIYYEYSKGWDLVDLYSKYNKNLTYYILENNKYQKISSIINNYKQGKEELTQEQMDKLLSSYGIAVNTKGEITKLNQSFDFYIQQEAYRPINYYIFSFYQKATKYNSSENYYILKGNQYSFAAKGKGEVDFYKNDYYIKLDNNKIKVYLSDEFNPETKWSMGLTNPEKLVFWFDFLDLDDGELAQYSVKMVGDRPKSVNDSDVKAIYYRSIPNVIFSGAEGIYIKTFINKEIFNSLDENGEKKIFYEKDIADEYIVASEYSVGKEYFRLATSDDKQTGYTYINLTSNIDDLFSISGQGKSAFDVLDNYLYDYAYCSQSITLSIIPIYYLQPNTRIFVHDENSGIDGEYLITHFSIPLIYNGTMSITAIRAVDRII